MSVERGADSRSCVHDKKQTSYAPRTSHPKYAAFHASSMRCRKAEDHWMITSVRTWRLHKQPPGPSDLTHHGQPPRISSRPKQTAASSATKQRYAPFTSLQQRSDLILPQNGLEALRKKNHDESGEAHACKPFHDFKRVRTQRLKRHFSPLQQTKSQREE